MARKKTAAAKTEDEGTDAVRKFEVVSPINVGRGVIHGVGATVLESDFHPKDLKELLDSGRLRDGDTPIPPSQAEGVRELNRLISIARKIGLVEQSGGDYTFGDVTAQGLTAFRAAVSADALEEAIVKAATGESE